MALSPADPARFTTSRSTLFLDRFMNGAITLGGLAIILAVFGIFLFIIKEIVPLFAGASVASSQLEKMETKIAHPLAFGMDEWGERPFILDGKGRLHILNPLAQTTEIIDLAEGRELTSAAWRAEKSRLAVGFADGHVRLLEMTFARDHTGEHGEAGEVVLSINEQFAIDLSEGPVRNLAFDDNGSKRLIAATIGEKSQTVVVPVVQKLGLGGRAMGKPKAGDAVELPFAGKVSHLLVNGAFDTIVALLDDREVVQVVGDGDGAYPILDRFVPFPESTVTTMEWLFGDQSLVLADAIGHNDVYSLFYVDGGSTRRFGKTKTLETLPGPATAYAESTRNKGYLIAAGTEVSLRYATTERIRWQDSVDQPVAAVAMNRKYSRFATLSETGTVSFFELSDPHPEGGLTAMFARVQYEGSDRPEWRWESTGGSDDFEPKISMIPLIWGTLKGTFFAMLFAVPIALAAALYCSEFMHPRFKSVVKPTMEIMASLPSVVLGYIAAQVLATYMEDSFPSIALLIILVPLIIAFFGAWWAKRSMRIRSRIKNGYEWLAIIPIGAIACLVAWEIGLVLDRVLFVYVNAETGDQVSSLTSWVSALFSSGEHARAGQFRLWWSNVMGSSYEQRNSLVVGVIMGFAVIPIIFTIAEDALTNVPKALRSASLALGATRWQTAMRVVLPTASAGIFSALMIGLGRAIGETMIVVMATGNTAIMTMNPFDGMRTLSANIAVELPEAALGGTLYRTLFFGAFLLFLMTFVINTLAEVMRQHLREKYKTV